jgi:hypothetical protein
LGVTIHFEGRLRDEAAFQRLVLQVEAFAEIKGWPAKRFQEPNVRLVRVIDGKDVDYVGPTLGIEVQPHPDSEGLRFEFDQSLFMQDFCKTQFAGLETHRDVVELLRELAPFFEVFGVFDDGELWETNDVHVLNQHLKTIDGLLADMKRQDPGGVGPIRLESGRIVDFIESDEREAPAEPKGLKRLLGFLRR